MKTNLKLTIVLATLFAMACFTGITLAAETEEVTTTSETVETAPTAEESIAESEKETTEKNNTKLYLILIGTLSLMMVLFYRMNQSVMKKMELLKKLEEATAEETENTNHQSPPISEKSEEEGEIADSGDSNSSSGNVNEFDFDEHENDD